MAIWIKLVEMKESKRDKDEGIDKKYTLKWQGMNADYISITMKFDDEEVMRSTLEKLGLTPTLGEQAQITIKPPKRMEEFGGE